MCYIYEDGTAFPGRLLQRRKQSDGAVLTYNGREIAHVNFTCININPGKTLELGTKCVLSKTLACIWVS